MIKLKGNLFMKLLVLFTIVPLAELYALFKIAQLTSWVWSVILVVATGIAGAYMAKREGRGIIRKIKLELGEGRIPGDELVNGLCVLVGGALLLTPGIITDILGLSLIVPVTRGLYKKYIKSKLSDIIQKGSSDIYYM